VRIELTTFRATSSAFSFEDLVDGVLSLLCTPEARGSLPRDEVRGPALDASSSNTAYGRAVSWVGGLTREQGSSITLGPTDRSLGWAVERLDRAITASRPKVIHASTGHWLGLQHRQHGIQAVW